MRRAALFACLVLLVAGCARNELVLLSSKDLPDTLYHTSGQVASPRRTTVTLYMVEGTRLAPVQRTGTTPQPIAQVAMNELLRGPTTAEFTKGYTTQIPEAVRLNDVSVDRGIASVDLSRDFELAAERTAFILRLAQVVWTLTELDNVDSVRFLVEGEPVSVMVQDTRLISEPVSRVPYSQFAPRSSGTPVSVEPISGG